MLVYIKAICIFVLLTQNHHMINSLKNPDKNIIPERIDAVSVMMPLSNSKSGLFTMEIWKDIKGHEGYYQISNYGRVKSLCTKKQKGTGNYARKVKILKPYVNIANGYPSIDFCTHSKKKKNTIHRLLALAFIPNPENKPCINHKNGIRNDNRLSNLEWCTYQENSIDCVKRKGIFVPQGEKCHLSKFTNKQVLKIKINKENLTIRQLSKKHNVSYGCIRDMIKNLTWKHIVVKS